MPPVESPSTSRATPAPANISRSVVGTTAISTKVEATSISLRRAKLRPRRVEYDVEGASRGFEVASSRVESRRDRQHRGGCGWSPAVQRRTHGGVERR